MRALCLATLAVAVMATGAAAEFYGSDTKVVNLDDSNFEESVLKSDDVWIIEFYAPWCGHCKNLVPEYKKAAKALEGHIKLGAVDATVAVEVGRKFEVQGFPTIKVFGKDKTAPTEYEGGRRAADFVKVARTALKEATGAEIPKLEEEAAGGGDGSGSGFYDKSDVTELTDETFESDVINGDEPWLVEFYAPWCGHCKNLVPDFKKAAADLVGSVRLGAIDATAHSKYSGKYNVKGFPTLKFFSPKGGEEGTPEDYEGPRTAEAFIDYCSTKAEKYPGKPILVQQIENQETLMALSEKKTTTGIFIIPHVIDTGAAGRNDLVEMFGRVAAKLRGKPVSLGWIVGGEHVNFEESMGVFSNYPAFILINAKKLRYANHMGSFNEAALITMAKKVLEGRLPTSAIRGTAANELPKLSKGVALWDGKDYVAPDEDY